MAMSQFERADSIVRKIQQLQTTGKQIHYYLALIIGDAELYVANYPNPPTTLPEKVPDLPEWFKITKCPVCGVSTDQPSPPCWACPSSTLAHPRPKAEVIPNKCHEAELQAQSFPELPRPIVLPNRWEVKPIPIRPAFYNAGTDTNPQWIPLEESDLCESHSPKKPAVQC